MFDLLSEKFSNALSFLTGEKKLTEKNIATVVQKINDALIEADVPYKTVHVFIEGLQKEALGAPLLKTLKPEEQFAKLVYERLVTFLGADKAFTFDAPRTIVMMGLQGSGKTTTIGKLAHAFNEHHKKGIRIIVSSADFYRPAAVEQLAILARSVGVDFYEPKTQDPVTHAQQFMQYAKKEKYDVIILDTAGRMHIDNTLLNELQAIVSSVQPTDKILVIDAMTGQESLTVARAFEEAVGFDGAVLAKVDGSAKGGVAFAFRYEMKKPIWFAGIGETTEDLEIFKGERFASRLIGMGDIESLLERAEKKIQQAEAQELENALSSGDMTIQAFGLQLRSMRKLGPLSSWLKYVPGAPRVDANAAAQSEKEIKKSLAIIDSMKPQERLDHTLLNASRRKRIARGAGVAIEDVQSFIRKFEEIRQCVKLLHRMGGRNPFKFK